MGLYSAMVLIIFMIFLCFPYKALSHSFHMLLLPTLGSESYTFDSNNNGPYTGLNDGRIVKYQGPNIGFVDFATTSPNRCKEMCDGKTGDDMIMGMACGRPIGLEFNHETGELYFVDAFRGLMMVGGNGGVATQLTSGEDGALDGIAIDPVTGVVYYTDVGTIFYKTTNMSEVLLSGDTSGRLLKYDPKTKQRTVILTGLAVPNGVAVSKDGSFVLVSEYLNCRITRFWVTGSRANTSETFVKLPGNPDNIRRTKSGDFWVPVNVQKLHPKLTSFPLGQRISAEGKILETVNFYAEYDATYVTEVHEHLGSLYVASVNTNFVGIYRELKC